MTAIQFITASLENSKNWFTALVTDLKDQPTARAVGPQGNHALWLLGHVLGSERVLVGTFILGEPRPTDGSDKLFGIGTKPLDDAAAYPSLDALAEQYAKVRVRTLEVLQTLTEADLDRASHAPAQLAAKFGTVGQCLNMLALHTMFHAGQVADIRKSLGRPPLLG